jgi:hypothetical protein
MRATLLFRPLCYPGYSVVQACLLLWMLCSLSIAVHLRVQYLGRSTHHFPTIRTVMGYFLYHNRDQDQCLRTKKYFENLRRDQIALLWRESDQWPEIRGGDPCRSIGVFIASICLSIKTTFCLSF